jgi:hypothetical protein
MNVEDNDTTFLLAAGSATLNDNVSVLLRGKDLQRPAR